MRWKWIFLAPLAILGIVVFMAIGGEVVMRLWNWLLPGLFGWRQLTFWQALGLLALCRILFGGLGRHGHGRRDWRARMKGRCSEMNPQEREKFRQAMRERWDFGSSPSASQPE
jgi:hypothetical protein